MTDDLTPSATQERLMREALAEARSGVDAGHGGPFGACVARGPVLIAAGHNTVLRDGDPTAHAEVNAIRAACRRLGTHDLAGCVLVSTAEPCPMCLAAIHWARLSGLVYGAGLACAARFGFDDAAFQAELARPAGERALPSRGGVLAAECEALFRHWQARGGRLY